MKNFYTIKDNVVLINIPSRYGKFDAIIDLDDLNLVNQYNITWTLTYRNQRIESVQTKIQRYKVRKVIFLHRLIMGFPDNLVIDHINRNPLDNRKSNLRVVTSNDNATNLREFSKSITGHRNIHFENGKYEVRIKRIRYGNYDTLEEAITVRNKLLPIIFPLRSLNGYK